ncbi:MAG: hypothetical protein B6I30_06095 [Desulfobacteraceae bacterium 4572_187]|nr:MAG: hypothetical protein B6I30_06095 [Desulfobacteraceae bacterium 4572_187]
MMDSIRAAIMMKIKTKRLARKVGHISLNIYLYSVIGIGPFMFVAHGSNGEKSQIIRLKPMPIRISFVIFLNPAHSRTSGTVRIRFPEDS